MEMVYFIKVDDMWQKVSYEEFKAFDGEKERRPSTWAISILNELLLPYRYM